MDRSWLALGLVILLAPQIPVGPPSDPLGSPPGPAPTGEIAPRRSTIPLSGFIENAGQLDDGSIRFYTTGPVPAAFTDSGVIFRLQGPDGASSYSMRFGGARPVRPQGFGALPGRSNFLFGNDPSEWRAGVPACEGLLYAGLYPGIDLAFLARDGCLKYEFRVEPWADPSAIRLEFDGALPSVEACDLVLSTPAGDVRDEGFSVYQVSGTGTSAVNARMVPEGRCVSFDIGGYDRSRPLVIDPLISSTVLGGVADDYAVSVAIDRFGNSYLAGETLSPDFPVTPNAWSKCSRGDNSSYDLFVAKISPDGKRAIFSTYIGSSGNDFAHDLRLDDSGAVYVAGYTYGFDFPVTASAFDRSYNGYGDAFALKLSPSGTTLIFSTFLGGEGPDLGYALAFGEDLSVYVGGGTYSMDFPVTGNALQASIRAGSGMEDAFAARLSADGSRLVYCTYLGGEGQDHVLAVGVGPDGSAYLTGATTSYDFPTTGGAFGRQNRNQDAFVARLDEYGSNLDYSTYLSGSGQDSGTCLALDSSGGCMVGGDTNSYDFPAVQRQAVTSFHGGQDGFLVGLDPSGANVTCGAFIGGSGEDGIASIDLDPAGDVTAAGTTRSADLAATPAAERARPAGRGDAFVARLDRDCSHLLYLSYFGGSGEDACVGAAADPSGGLRLAGTTSSTDLPGAPSGASNGTDVFLVRLALVLVPGPPGLMLSTGDHVVSLAWTVPETGAGDLQGYILYRGLQKTDLNVSWRLPSEVLDFADEGVPNGVNYHYALSAVNASGEGERSALVTAMAGFSPTPPLNLSARGRPSLVALSWQPPARQYDMPLLGYRIYRWTFGQPATLLAELSSGTTYNDRAVFNDFEYSYEITAFNIMGESESSGKAGAIPSDRPSPPRNLKAYLDGRAVTLSWDPPDNPGSGSIEDYLVFFQLEDGRRRTVGRTQVMLYVDRDLLAGRHRYRVAANSTAGEGYATGEVAADIVNLPPVASFTVGSLESTSTVPFNFSSTSYDRDTYIVNYTWDFGDGARSFKQDPAHYYLRRGMYNVTLRVRDLDGAVGESAGMVVVVNTPPSMISFTPAASMVAYVGRPRDFSVTPQDPDADTLSTTWYLNGSVAGTGNRLRRSFYLTGSFVLSATVSDGESTATTSWNVTVEPAPPPGPPHLQLQWLLGAALAAAAAASAVLAYRLRTARRREASRRPPVRSGRTAGGPTRSVRRPVKKRPQKDIIRKRYS